MSESSLDKDLLSEIQKKIFETENASLILCENLLTLCEETLPKAGAYSESICKELDKLDQIEESYNKMYRDLLNNHRILHTIYLCPCLPESMLQCLTVNEMSDSRLEEVISEKKKVTKMRRDQHDKTKEYIKNEFANLGILKDVVKENKENHKYITRLTGSDIEKQMEKKLSNVFADLLKLQTTIREMLSSHRKQDKKIIEIQYKSKLTSLLLESQDRTLKQF